MKIDLKMIKDLAESIEKYNLMKWQLKVKEQK